MDQALRKQWMMAQQDQQISEAISREQTRLRNFIRKRVADQGDAEDILQDVFYELVELYRMMKPVEQVTAWMFRVARNRITDLFRRKNREGLRNEPAVTEDGEVRWLEELPRRWTRGSLRAQRPLRGVGRRLGRVAGRAARSFHRSRTVGVQLQGACPAVWRQREHAAFAQALCGPAPAPATASHLRRIQESMRTKI